jgi:FemAB-related protein (PEP-CTERM system-associated)
MLNPGVCIQAATDRDWFLWDQYVDRHPCGIPFHLSGFVRAVTPACGFDSIGFMARDRNSGSGRIRGVLPLVHVHFPLLKGTLVSLPYCDAAGILADTPDFEAALLAHALAYAAKKNIPQVVIRSVAPFAGQDPEFTRHPGKVRMVRSLPDNPDRLLQSLKAKVRSQVKKPIRDGLSFHLGGRELLPGFYTVFCENMRDLGSPPHGLSWFVHLFSKLGNRAHVGLVCTPGGIPAAAGIILCHPRVVAVPWASSLRRFNPMNPNMLLYWGFLSFAARNGFKQFDFGRSTPGEGTCRFKKQWEAVPEDLHWAGFTPMAHHIPNETTFTKHPLVPFPLDPETDPRLRTSSPRQLAETLLKHLPVPVNTFLGTQTRKFISL